MVDQILNAILVLSNIIGMEPNVHPVEIIVLNAPIQNAKIVPTPITLFTSMTLANPHASLHTHHQLIMSNIAIIHVLQISS